MVQFKLKSLALPFMLAGALTFTGVLAQDAEITGTVNVMGFGTGDEIATERVALFEETYPGVEVTFTEGALDEQQFLTSVASGNPPDAVYIDRALLSTYAVRGALQPLTACIDQAGIDMSIFRPAAVEQVTVDGEIYGIPDFYNNIFVMVNTKALDDAGLTLEDVNTSDWEALSALNDALTVNDGEVTRIGFDPKLPEFFPLWVEANGSQILSDDGRTAMLNTPEAVEALEYANSLHEAAGGRAAFVAFRDTWDFFGSNNQIAADQVGAWPMEQWYMNVLADVSPDAPIAFTPFLDREGNPISFATGSAWAIPTNSPNFDAACALAATMTSTDAWVRAATARAEIRAESGALNTGVSPANMEAEGVIFSDIVGPTGSDVFDSGIETLLSVQEGGFAIPANPAGNEFRQSWFDAVNRVLNGEQTAQEALDQAQAEAQAALDEAWLSQ
jgi:multiple sugar transport system substrate-binding protein